MSQLVKINLPNVRQEVSLAGEWFAQRDEALAKAKVFEVATIDNANAIGESVSELGKIASKIEAERKKITAPFLTAQRTIKGVVDHACKDLHSEVTRLKGLIADLAEAERQRIAKEQAEAEAARLAIEAEAAEQAAMEEELFGESTQVITVEAEIEAEAAPKFDGVRLSEAVVFCVTNEEKIPRCFTSFDPSKLRAWIAERKGDLLKELKNTKFVQPINGIELKIESKVAIR